MTRGAHHIWTLPLAIALCGLVASAPGAAAQTPPPAGANASVDPSGSGGGFFGDPTAWATTVFHEAITALMRSTTTDVVSLMDWLMGSEGNVISQTPPALSYDNSAVRHLWSAMRAVANSLLGVLAVWGGFNVIVHPHIRAPYHTAMELLPRLVLGALLVNTSLDWGRFVISLNNALCQSFGSVMLPAWDQVNSGLMGFVVALIALLVYLVMGLLLLVQMLMRLALVDVLLIVAPLALLCWVLPQTHGWAQLWFSIFFGTVFSQFVQVLVLQLGTALIAQVTSLASPEVLHSDAPRAAMLGLILGVAVLHLAQRVPRIMLGYVGGAMQISVGRFSGYTQLSSANTTGRQMARIATAVRSMRGGS